MVESALSLSAGAHKHALQLLGLPVDRRPTAEDSETRAVLRASYRLLKAMCTGSPLMQTELVRHIPTFLEHVSSIGI